MKKLKVGDQVDVTLEGVVVRTEPLECIADKYTVCEVYLNKNRSVVTFSDDAIKKHVKKRK